MDAVAEPQPAPDAPSHGAATRCQSWMRRSVIAAMALFALRGLAIVLGEFAPGHPWIGGWAYAAPGVDRRALFVWTAMMVGVYVRPHDVGLPAPWDWMAEVARSILLISLNTLIILYLARATATATQQDIDAKLGIRRAER